MIVYEKVIRNYFSGYFQNDYLSQWLHTLGSSRFSDDAVLLQRHNEKQIKFRQEFKEITIFFGRTTYKNIKIQIREALK